eukprot:1160868-Pelagomonas_calceolata.AAC.6
MMQRDMLCLWLAALPSGSMLFGGILGVLHSRPTAMQTAKPTSWAHRAKLLMKSQNGDLSQHPSENDSVGIVFLWLGWCAPVASQNCRPKLDPTREDTSPSESKGSNSRNSRQGGASLSITALFVRTCALMVQNPSHANRILRRVATSLGKSFTSSRKSRGEPADERGAEAVIMNVAHTPASTMGSKWLCEQRSLTADVSCGMLSVLQDAKSGLDSDDSGSEGGDSPKRGNSRPQVLPYTSVSSLGFVLIARVGDTTPLGLHDTEFDDAANRALLSSARKGDLNGVKEALDRNADPNLEDFLVTPEATNAKGGLGHTISTFFAFLLMGAQPLPDSPTTLQAGSIHAACAIQSSAVLANTKQTCMPFVPTFPFCLLTDGHDPAPLCCGMWAAVLMGAPHLQRQRCSQYHAPPAAAWRTQASQRQSACVLGVECVCVSLGAALRGKLVDFPGAECPAPMYPKDRVLLNSSLDDHWKNKHSCFGSACPARCPFFAACHYKCPRKKDR